MKQATVGQVHVGASIGRAGGPDVSRVGFGRGRSWQSVRKKRGKINPFQANQLQEEARESVCVRPTPMPFSLIACSHPARGWMWTGPRFPFESIWGHWMIAECIRGHGEDERGGCFLSSLAIAGEQNVQETACLRCHHIRATVPNTRLDRSVNFLVNVDDNGDHYGQRAEMGVP